MLQPWHSKYKCSKLLKRLEEHLQDICGADVIFKEIQTKKIRKFKLKIWNKILFEEKKFQVHDPMEKVNFDTVEELRITYISSLLPPNL